MRIPLDAGAVRPFWGRLARLARSALLTACCAATLLTLPAQAQDDDWSAIELPGSQRLCFGMAGIVEPRALAICDALALRQNVRARELAQAWVNETPDSPAAQFALSEVLFRVEGNLPRALYHLNQAEALMDYPSLGRALQSGNLEWHYLTLSQLSYANQLIGNQEKALEYLDKVSAIYGQDIESFRGWPLIKMKRYDEARASAEKVLATSNDRRDRSRAWNTLCAVELADLRPNESLLACENAMTEDQDLAAQENEDDLNTVHLLNASEVSLNLLRFDEAENYLDRASRRIDPNSVGNPWVYKLYLYMAQGRFDAAREALDNMMVWRDAQTPLVVVMNRTDHFMVSSIFLMLAGYPDDAVRLTQAALNQPDRTGSYTADEAQKDSYAALINSLAHRIRYQQLREEIATRPLWSGIRLRIEALAVRLHAWRAGRHAASLFAERETLQNRLRPYAPLDVHIPEWLEPELMALLGPGVMQQLLDDNLAKGAYALNEGYYYAYRTEIEALRRRNAQTRQAALTALQLLPAQEVLLRARVGLRLAEAAWAEGDYTTANEYYSHALRLDPDGLRRLDVRLPVRITGDDHAFGRELAGYLRRSPRFRQHEAGLPLEILPEDAQAVCLRAPDGDALSCIQLNPVENDLADSDAQHLARQFQQGTFSLAYDISRNQRLALLGGSVITSNQNNTNLQERRDAVLQP